jgi:hypothetical protein
MKPRRHYRSLASLCIYQKSDRVKKIIDSI